MTGPYPRRHFLQTSLLAAAAGSLSPSVASAADDRAFQLSLNEWSLERSLSSGRLGHLDFASTARREFGLSAIEYVSRFFGERLPNEKYLRKMNKRAADHEVRQLLIMVDAQGRLADPDAPPRKKAVENRLPWIDAAQTLGCHSIAVDVCGEGTYEEQLGRAAEGLAALGEYGDRHEINVLVGGRNGLSPTVGWC